MNTQMMAGLMGANANIRMADTPMRVYRQASAEGDTEKMQRALGYAGEHMDNAAEYQDTLDKGMKAEAKAEREKAKLAQEAAIEKRREERRKAENGTNSASPETDSVRISEAAKSRAKEYTCPGRNAGCPPPSHIYGNRRSDAFCRGRARCFCFRIEEYKETIYQENGLRWRAVAILCVARAIFPPIIKRPRPLCPEPFLSNIMHSPARFCSGSRQ